MMKRAVLFALIGTGAIALAPTAHAQTTLSEYFQVVNLTQSSGDPIFSVTDNVTLSNLALTETFADSTTSTVALLDATGTPATSLNATDLFLQSNSFTAPDSAHGAIIAVLLTGNIGLPTLNLQTSIGGSINTVVVVAPNFSASLFGAPATSSYVETAIGTLALVDGNNNVVGTQNVFVATVPEPGAVALFVGFGMGTASLLRRRIRRA